MDIFWNHTLETLLHIFSLTKMLVKASNTHNFLVGFHNIYTGTNWTKRDIAMIKCLAYDHCQLAQEFTGYGIITDVHFCARHTDLMFSELDLRSRGAVSKPNRATLLCS